MSRRRQVLGVALLDRLADFRHPPRGIIEEQTDHFCDKLFVSIRLLEHRLAIERPVRPAVSSWEGSVATGDRVMEFNHALGNGFLKRSGGKFVHEGVKPFDLYQLAWVVMSAISFFLTSAGENGFTR